MNPQTLESHINSDCVLIWKWCNKWRVSINLPKTKYMIFTKKNNISLTIRFQPDLTPLEVVREKRALGIILDDKLSFKKHISTILRSTFLLLRYLIFRGCFLISQPNFVLLLHCIVVVFLCSISTENKSK